MSNKEKQGFFRRIRSPLEHRSTSKHEEKQCSSSTSVIPVQHSNGHGGDDVLKIENTAYGDPDILSGNRSYSTGTSPGDILNPPLPPRNPPKQLLGLQQQPTSSPSNASCKMNDESPVYVAPADTLQRSGGGASTGNLSKAVLANYTRAEPLSAPPSKNERKVMEMHQLTMSQRQRQDTGQSAAHAHHQQQRVQVQNVVDNSEYSTPFNLIQQQQQQKAANRAGSGKGGSGSTRQQQQQRRVPQIGMAEENDQIIPVLSPPPGHSDRSQTTSPSSPLSTPSSEHEEGGTGGRGGSVSSAGGGGDSDYDVPWDRKFKGFQLISQPPNPKRQTSGGKVHHPDDGKEFHPLPGSRGGRRESPPQRNMYQRHSDRNSPPAPPDRNPPASYHTKGRKTSPQPPDELLLSRPPASRYLPSRHQSEQHRPRDGSTSPNQMMGRYGGHTIHGPHIQRELPPEISPRTSSMSASHMSGRRLPSPPRERSESSPIDRRGVLRPPSPPNPVHIDFSIPLCDQPWYHGDIKRRDAEQVLIDQPDFSFLVRDSESCKTDYSLSIRDSANGFIHLRMVQETDTNNQLGYVLGQFSSHFSTVAECIAFYTKQRLNIRGAEHKKLRYPVPRASDTMASFRV